MQNDENRVNREKSEIRKGEYIREQKCHIIDRR